MISMIVCVCQNKGIGKDNELLVRISDDLKRFRSITMGQTIVMGRKTFESLPHVLPKRTHVVLTRDRDFDVGEQGVFVEWDLRTVLEPYLSLDSPEIFIMGGASLYAEALPYCHKIYMTKVKATLEADSFFPELDRTEWGILENSAVMKDEKTGYEYEYVTFARKK